MSAEDAAWAQCAARLGLDVRRATSRLHPVDNFGSMVRALGPRATDGITTDDWLFGPVNGVPVLMDVRQRRKRQGLVAMTAAIDPPLGVGLQAKTDAGLLAVRVPLGHPQLDANFATTALDTDAARRLLLGARGGWEGADVLLRLAAATRDVSITDNVVSASLHTDAMRSPEAFVAPLGLLTHAAKTLGAERIALPWHPSMPIDAWAAFATESGLAFDRPRFKLSGSYQGVDVELRLHTANGRMYGATRVAIGQDLGVGLRLVGRADGQVLEYDEDWIDIEVGDPAFDESFLVHANDASRARTILAAPSIRNRALALLARTIDLVVLDTHLSAALRAADLYDARFLASILDEMSALARDLVAASRTPSAPYR